MPLYNRLKEHRARLGVNQQEMGSLAGVSRQTISQIERGDYSPSVTLALKLARICGVTVEDIFTYQEDGDIIGFKWLSCDCNEKRPCAMVLFDMNGTKAPNRIGTDVFGFFLFKDRIEAFGANMTNEQLEEDCGKHSNGLSCSEYYLRGGRF